MGKDTKLFSLVGIVLPIIGFIINYLVAKNDKTAMFYGRQGLILGLFWIVGMTILAFIPIIGWILLPIYGLAMVILWLIGIYYAFKGKQKPIPIIGTII